MNVAGKKCAKCSKNISCIFDGYWCRDCKLAFHTSCMKNEIFCPNCNLDLIKEKEKIENEIEKVKTPEEINEEVKAIFREFPMYMYIALPIQYAPILIFLTILIPNEIKYNVRFMICTLVFFLSLFIASIVLQFQMPSKLSNSKYKPKFLCSQIITASFILVVIWKLFMLYAK